MITLHDNGGVTVSEVSVLEIRKLLYDLENNLELIEGSDNADSWILCLTHGKFDGEPFNRLTSK